jgi:antitoxin component YwqK of YwqJK toxin-antitoxin module
MRNFILWLLLAGAGLFLLGGCGGEPHRGPILKDTEKVKDSDKVFREIEYYLDRRGQKVEHGRVVQYFPAGQVQFRCEMRDGKTQGTYEQFYPTGEKEIVAQYQAGKLAGKFEKFYKNGKLAVAGQNVKDLQDGTWVYYGEDGKVLREELWKQGDKLSK